MSKSLKKVPFYLLKSKMATFGISQEDLGDMIGRSRYYINSRLQCKQEFSLSDIYNICEELDIEKAEIPTYFPKDGILKDLKVAASI